MKKLFMILIVLFVGINISFAKDIKFDPGSLPGQSEFDDFITELGTSLVFAPMAPAETLGITGFDVSGEVLASKISGDSAFWEKMLDEEPFDYLPMPRLHVQKGLPFGIDVGGIYLAVPDSNVKLMGLEAKWALPFFEGGILWPAISVRCSYTQLMGVDDIDLNTMALDVMVSKGILMLTPYAGISYVMINGSENYSGVTLEDVEENMMKTFAGVQFSPLPLIVLNFEASYGEIPQYGLKIGIRF